MTAVIIDDEQRGRFALAQKLTNYCHTIELIGEAESGEEGIALIQKLAPEIVFLDIEMPYMNGFEMLALLPNKNFHLIFTTAYDQFAIKAIKFAAFDYLLKPIDIDELKTAISKLTALPWGQTQAQVAILKENLKSKAPFSKLAISTAEGLLFFDVSEIIHLEANSNYTNIYFADDTKLLASKTLKDFEDILPTEIFFRSHHSHIINLNFIKKYIKGDGGRIEMKNGNVAELARRKKDEFYKIIGH